MRRAVAVAALLAAAATSGCSGSASSPSAPRIAAARTFELAGFEPRAPSSSRTFELAFRILQPSGRALTTYRRGPGPHTGVHVILVRSDLGAIVHRHPPIGAGGRVSERITVPTSGRYRLVVDAYPSLSGPLRNFQLFRWIRVAGAAPSQHLPPFRADAVVDGYRFHVRGKVMPRAIQASFLTIDVTDPQGHPARFTPWYGALAHAIFFRQGTLSYFHTHVCGAGATGCASTFGPTSVTGTSTAPGRLRIGVLLPLPGVWRLFVQCRVGGRVLTVPFTLKAAA